jgi:hypothetical protein
LESGSWLAAVRANVAPGAPTGNVGQTPRRRAGMGWAERAMKGSAVASLAFVGISPLFRGAELTRCDVRARPRTYGMDHRYQPASGWADRVTAVPGAKPVA